MFFVLYGVNNVGKTTQMNLLEERMRRLGKKYKRIKYPIYDLEPTGRRLNEILRRSRDGLTIEEIQEIYARNRRDFEPTLKLWLKEGYLVLAEDYLGTGIAWGMAEGVSLQRMEEINEDLLRPDMAVLLDGPRKEEAKEKGHLFEDSDKWNVSRRIHLDLAKRYGWRVVEHTGVAEDVADKIWKVLGIDGGVKNLVR